MNEKIEDIIKDTINSMGMEIVRISTYSKAQRNFIEILLENSDGSSVDISQCEKASDAISALLDVEDIIDYKYHLDVSSAGIERPLVKIKDFTRFKGSEMFVVLSESIDLDGELLRKFECVIMDTDEKEKIVSVKKDNDKIFDIEFDEIERAKLVISEEAIRKILQDKKKLTIKRS